MLRSVSISVTSLGDFGITSLEQPSGGHLSSRLRAQYMCYDLILLLDVDLLQV
jgi:hypothetical protein